MGRTQAISVRVLERHKDANGVWGAEIRRRTPLAPQRATQRCLGNTVALMNTLVLGPLG